MGVRPTRVVRILLAGVVGAFVALLFLVLRPDAPFERSQSAAVPSPRTTDVGVAVADARSAAGRLPSEDPRASSEVDVDAAAPRPTVQDSPPTRVAAGGPVPAAPATAASAVRDGEQRTDDPAETENEPERPAQWCFLKTRDDHDYLSDIRAVFNGSRSAWLGKDDDLEAGGGYFSSDILWQGVDATAFRGLRIEVSAHVKGMGYFQFFVRTANAADRGIVLSDSQLPSVPMTNRYVSLFPPNGAEWVRLSIVADVPVESDIVYYGIGLNGGRAIWIDDIRIARVDLETPLTQERSHGGRLILPVDGGAALAAPANLDFEVTTHGAPGC